MKIIGITGKKNAGKSTVAALLVEKLGYKEFAFADPLKQILEILFLLDPKYFHDRELKEQTIEELRVSPRRLMQQIGTDLFRDKLEQALPELDLGGHAFWIWHMQQRIKKYVNELKTAEKEPLIVISDIRFDDELVFVRSLTFGCAGLAMDSLFPVILEIRRDQPINIKHKSEGMVCISEFPSIVVLNNGSIEHLQNSVLEYLNIN